jgi:hypothetical protein
MSDAKRIGRRNKKIKADKKKISKLENWEFKK